MKWNVITLLVAAWLLGTGMTTAQELYQVGFVDAGTVPADLPRQLYEEIEIMRRILDRDLHATVPAGTGSLGFSAAGKEQADKYLAGIGTKGFAFGDPHHGLKGDPYGGSEWRGPHGVYLKGCGVVYSGALPVHFQSAVRESGAAKQPQPLSQWERVRRELHGEKAEQEKERERQAPSLSEVVLKALAENGKHFTQLAENEQVTVALTLFQGQACSACHGGHDSRATAGGGGRITSQYFSPDPNLNQQNAAGGGGTPTPSTSGQPGTPSTSGQSQERIEARRQLLMGDLHLKQNGPQSAIEMYEKAWLAYRKLLDEEPKAASATPDWQLHLEAVELLGKLGQCYRSKGDVERTRKVVDYLALLGQKAGQPEGKAASVAGPLPAKLIVSASKKVLDQVGSGKLSFDEFKKAATVQYLDFSVKTEKEPAKP
jgi:hypothetical protein